MRFSDDTAYIYIYMRAGDFDGLEIYLEDVLI